jgi:hypothetical protein
MYALKDVTLKKQDAGLMSPHKLGKIAEMSSDSDELGAGGESPSSVDEDLLELLKGLDTMREAAICSMDSSDSDQDDAQQTAAAPEPAHQPEPANRAEPSSAVPAEQPTESFPPEILANAPTMQMPTSQTPQPPAAASMPPPATRAEQSVQAAAPPAAAQSEPSSAITPSRRPAAVPSLLAARARASAAINQPATSRPAAWEAVTDGGALSLQQQAIAARAALEDRQHSRAAASNAIDERQHSRAASRAPSSGVYRSGSQTERPAAAPRLVPRKPATVRPVTERRKEAADEGEARGDRRVLSVMVAAGRSAEERVRWLITVDEQLGEKAIPIVSQGQLWGV